MPKGQMNMAGVPKPPSPSKPQAKNRTNMPRKPKLSKIGDASMRMNQKGLGVMTPKLLNSKKGGTVPKPKKPKLMKSKVPKLNLPTPAS